MILPLCFFLIKSLHKYVFLFLFTVIVVLETIGNIQYIVVKIKTQ